MSRFAATQTLTPGPAKVSRLSPNGAFAQFHSTMCRNETDNVLISFRRIDIQLTR